MLGFELLETPYINDILLSAGCALTCDDIGERRDRKISVDEDATTPGRGKAFDPVRCMNQVECERACFEQDNFAAAQDRNRQSRIEIEAEPGQGAQNPPGIAAGAGQEDIDILGGIGISREESLRFCQ